MRRWRNWHPFDRVDHDPAEDMADCAVISQALGADIAKICC